MYQEQKDLRQQRLEVLNTIENVRSNFIDHDKGLGQMCSLLYHL